MLYFKPAEEKNIQYFVCTKQNIFHVHGLSVFQAKSPVLGVVIWTQGGESASTLVLRYQSTVTSAWFWPQPPVGPIFGPMHTSAFISPFRYISLFHFPFLLSIHIFPFFSSLSYVFLLPFPKRKGGGDIFQYVDPYSAPSVAWFTCARTIICKKVKSGSTSQSAGPATKICTVYHYKYDNMNNMGDCLNSMITMTVSSTSRMVCSITTGNWTAYIYLKNQYIATLTSAGTARTIMLKQ